MKKFVIYIAGPFRSKKNTIDQWEQTQNIRRAEALALEVWRAGHIAICPHLNTLHFQGCLPDEVWLEGDLEIVRRCDAVLLTEGWRNSAGARREVEEARRHGKAVAADLVILLARLANGFPIFARDIRPPCPEIDDVWVRGDERFVWNGFDWEAAK
jgi:hypothetical protein